MGRGWELLDTLVLGDVHNLRVGREGIRGLGQAEEAVVVERRHTSEPDDRSTHGWQV